MNLGGGHYLVIEPWHTTFGVSLSRGPRALCDDRKVILCPGQPIGDLRRRGVLRDSIISLTTPHINGCRWMGQRRDHIGGVRVCLRGVMAGRKITLRDRENVQDNGPKRQSCSRGSRGFTLAPMRQGGQPLEHERLRLRIPRSATPLDHDRQPTSIPARLLET